MLVPWRIINFNLYTQRFDAFWVVRQIINHFLSKKWHPTQARDAVLREQEAGAPRFQHMLFICFWNAPRLEKLQLHRKTDMFTNTLIFKWAHKNWMWLETSLNVGVVLNWQLQWRHVTSQEVFFTCISVNWISEVKKKLCIWEIVPKLPLVGYPPPQKNRNRAYLGFLPNTPRIIGSMYGIFTYIWMIFMVNVGKYTVPCMDGMGIWSWKRASSTCFSDVRMRSKRRAFASFTAALFGKPKRPSASQDRSSDMMITGGGVGNATFREHEVSCGWEFQRICKNMVMNKLTWYFN